MFGSLCHFKFTLPPGISHLIQARLRFYRVFVSLYVLGEAATHTLFVSPYELRLGQKLQITERSTFFARRPLNKITKKQSGPNSITPCLEQIIGVAVVGGGRRWLSRAVARRGAPAAVVLGGGGGPCCGVPRRTALRTGAPKSGFTGAGSSPAAELARFCD
jgi:hypothetical protein